MLLLFGDRRIFLVGELSVYGFFPDEFQTIRVDFDFLVDNFLEEDFSLLLILFRIVCFFFSCVMFTCCMAYYVRQSKKRSDEKRRGQKRPEEERRCEKRSEDVRRCQKLNCWPSDGAVSVAEDQPLGVLLPERLRPENPSDLGRSQHLENEHMIIYNDNYYPRILRTLCLFILLILLIFHHARISTSTLQYCICNL